MSYAGTVQTDNKHSWIRASRFSLNDGSMVFIPLLFYSFFCQSLASSSIVLGACLGVSFVSFVMHFLTNKRFANKKFGLEVVWIPFFILFFTHAFMFGISNRTLLIVYTLLFLSMYVAAGEKKWIASCIKVLIVFSAFHALCTIVFWLIPAIYTPVKTAFFSSSYMASDYRAGFTAHYSTNSIYLSLGLVFSACGLIGCRAKPQAKDVCLCLLFLFALFLTTKRGPLIASFAAIAVSYLYVNKDKFTSTALKFLVIALVVVVVVGVLAMSVPAVQATLERFVELSEDKTGNGRTYLYDYAWSMFHANPLFGGGWGSYSGYVNTTALGVMYMETGFSSIGTHNVYLQLLAETGVVGFGLFVASASTTLIVTMHRSQLYQGKDYCDDSFCLWACLGAQFFFLIYCFSGNPLYDPQCYIPYFISCIAVFAICGTDAKRHALKK